MKRSVAHALCAGVILASAALPPPARSLAEDEPAVAVRAVFETRVEAGRGRIDTQRWSFTRRENELEYHYFGSGVTERWSRDARGNTSYLRVFHRENTAIRYTHGDLLAFGVRADWTKLGHVVLPSESEGFVPRGSRVVFGRTARLFQRTLGSQQVVVSWLTGLGIPADVRITAPARRVRVRLVELTRELPPRLELTRFRQIDVSDYGDMERDPFVLQHHDDPLPTGVPTFGITQPSPRPSRNDAASSHVTDSRHTRWGIHVRRLRTGSD